MMRRFTRTASLPLERKFSDISEIFSPNIAGGQNLQPLILIEQGTSASERIGNACTFVSFQMRLTVVKAVVPNFNYLRWMLVMDRQPNGANLVIANILADTVEPIESPRNLSFNRRFKYLSQGMIRVTVQNPSVSIRRFVRLRNPVRYSAGAPTIDVVTANALHFVVMSDGADTAAAPTVNYFIRMRFVG